MASQSAAAPAELSSRSAEYWIQTLKLLPHPEGGYYREVAHSNFVVQNEAGRHRLAYTTIYFLLTPENPSHLHRLSSDETWLYHAGDPLQVHCLYKNENDDAKITIPDDRAISYCGATGSRCCNAGDAAQPSIAPATPMDDPERLQLHTHFTPAYSRLADPTADGAEPKMATAARPEYQQYRCIAVGPRVDRGEVLQYTVPGEAIFGSSVARLPSDDGDAFGFSLVSCIVSPGFDFRDFELFTQADLLALCPQHEAIIRQMAYEKLPSA